MVTTPRPAPQRCGAGREILRNCTGTQTGLPVIFYCQQDRKQHIYDRRIYHGTFSGFTYRKFLSYPESAEVAVHADEIDADLKACSR